MPNKVKIGDKTSWFHQIGPSGKNSDAIRLQMPKFSNQEKQLVYQLTRDRLVRSSVCFGSLKVQTFICDNQNEVKTQIMYLIKMITKNVLPL